MKGRWAVGFAYAISRAPGMPVSSVASLAPCFAATASRWPSVVCAGVWTQAGKRSQGTASGRNACAKPGARHMLSRMRRPSASWRA